MLLNVHGLIVNVEGESFSALARKFLCVSRLLFTPILQHVVGPEIFFFTTLFMTGAQLFYFFVDCIPVILFHFVKVLLIELMCTLLPNCDIAGKVPFV